MAEIKKKIEMLEEKIKKLITSHQDLKASIATLKKERLKMEKLLEEEKARLARMEEGYKQLSDSEHTKNREKIKAVRTRINTLVGEIDKSLTLINKK